MTQIILQSPSVEQKTDSKESGEKPSSVKNEPAQVPSKPTGKETGKVKAIDKSSSKVVGAELGLSEACDLLSQVIDKELEALSRAGAEAFTKKDIKGAEKILKKSASVAEFRDQLNALVSQLKDKL